MFEATSQSATSRPRALAAGAARHLPAIALGVLFIFIGYGKFEGRGVWVRIFEQIGLGQWFRILTGVVQVAGGVLMLPRRTRAIGSALLGCTMLGAAVVDVVVIGSPIVIVPLLLLILIGVVWVTSR